MILRGVRQAAFRKATRIAGIVLPSPKTGKNAPCVDLINTQYERLPMQPTK
jgi:hypothetical protein